MKDCGWWKGHDWAKWETYEEHFKNSHWTAPDQLFDTIEDWQKRRCLQCGLEQRREI